MKPMTRNILLVAVFITSCTKMCQKSHDDMSAEDVLQAYLNVAFNMEDLKQKDSLLELTTGELKAALAGASDETITEAYIKKRYELKRLSIVERRDSTPRETEITYQLSYKELQEGVINSDELPTVTTENTVAVVKENGKWFLKDVIGNKTSIDFPLTRESIIKPTLQ